MSIYIVRMVRMQVDMSSINQGIQSVDNTSPSAAAELTAKYNTLDEKGTLWFRYFSIILWLSIWMVTLVFQDILILVSILARSITIKAIDYNFFTQMTLSFLTLSCIIWLNIKYYQDISLDWDNHEKKEKHYRFMLKISEGTFGSNTIIWFIYATLVFRIMYLIIYSKSFGWLIKIMAKMLGNTLRFVAIALIVLVGFSVVGHTLFYDIEEYNTFFMAFNTLYASLLGSFNFETFSAGQRMPILVGRTVHGFIHICVNCVIDELPFSHCLQYFLGL